jgi:hypothetical protein
MRIGIFADVHDHLDNLRLAVEFFNARQCAAVIFAGDLVSTFAVPPLRKLNCPFYGCFGDNEGNRPGLLAGMSIVGELRDAPALYTLPDGTRIVVMHMERQLRGFDEPFDVAVDRSRRLLLSLLRQHVVEDLAAGREQQPLDLQVGRLRRLLFECVHNPVSHDRIFDFRFARRHRPPPWFSSHHSHHRHDPTPGSSESDVCTCAGGSNPHPTPGPPGRASSGFAATRRGARRARRAPLAGRG